MPPLDAASLLAYHRAVLAASGALRPRPRPNWRDFLSLADAAAWAAAAKGQSGRPRRDARVGGGVPGALQPRPAPPPPKPPPSAGQQFVSGRVTMEALLQHELGDLLARLHKVAPLKRQPPPSQLPPMRLIYGSEWDRLEHARLLACREVWRVEDAYWREALRPPKGDAVCAPLLQRLLVLPPRPDDDDADNDDGGAPPPPPPPRPPAAPPTPPRRAAAPPDTLTMLAFADDVVFTLPNRDAVVATLHLLCALAPALGILINVGPNKTAVVAFGRDAAPAAQHDPIPLPPDAPVAGRRAAAASAAFQDSYRYLGVHLRANMSQEADAGMLRGAAEAKFRSIFYTTPAIHLLGLRYQLQLLRTYVMPSLTWALGVRGLTLAAMHRLSSALRRMVRYVLGLGTHNVPNLIIMAALVGMPPIHVLATTAAIRVTATVEALAARSPDLPAARVLAAVQCSTVPPRLPGDLTWAAWAAVNSKRAPRLIRTPELRALMVGLRAAPARRVAIRGLTATLRKAMGHQQWRSKAFRRADPDTAHSRRFVRSDHSPRPVVPRLAVAEVVWGSSVDVHAALQRTGHRPAASDGDDGAPPAAAPRGRPRGRPPGRARAARNDGRGQATFASDVGLTVASRAVPHPATLSPAAWTRTPLSRLGPGGVGLLPARSRLTATQLAFVLRAPMGRRALFMRPADSGHYAVVMLRKHAGHPEVAALQRLVQRSSGDIVAAASSEQRLADAGAAFELALSRQALPRAVQVARTDAATAAGAGPTAARLPPAVLWDARLPEDGGPSPLVAGAVNGTPLFGLLDALPEDMAAALRFTRQDMAKFRARLGAMVKLPCGLPDCKGAREDTYHLIAVCPNKLVARARREHLFDCLPQLLGDVFSVLTAEARFALPDAACEQLRDDCGAVLARLLDERRPLRISNREAKWIMFRCALVAPWSEATAFPTHTLAARIGSIFDRVPLSSPAINRIADVWSLWALTATLALVSARKAVYAAKANEL